jgi:hypothetical protein
MLPSAFTAWHQNRRIPVINMTVNPRMLTGMSWGKSTILSVDAHGFKFVYTLNSAKHIPFDWAGP